MDFAKLIRTMRVIGPNIQLLSRITNTDKETLLSYLKNIVGLQFTPITKVSSLSIDKAGFIRRSVKNNRGITLKGNSDVIEMRNYSGIPEAYDWLKDTWNMELDYKANYMSIIPDEFSGTEIISSIKSLSLKEPLLSMVNASLIKGFVVDYGKRDFYIDIITLDSDILDAIEQIPFIRITYVLRTKEESVILYFVELFVPERYFTYVIKIVRMICQGSCEILVSQNSYLSSKKII